MAVAGVSTTILGLDHNWNTTFPQSTAESCGSDCYLNQLQAAATPGTIGAAAFHCYGGDPSAQDSVTLPIYETECSTSGYYTADSDSQYAGNYSTAPANFASDLLWDTGYLTIEGLRDGDSGGVSGAGAKSVMLWNLAGNQSYGPTINSGCTVSASGGACLPVEEAADPNNPVPQVGYYILAQVSHFVQPGAVRIASSMSGDIATVAFQNPNGQIVLVVLNTQPVVCGSVACTAPSSSEPFTVSWPGQTFSGSIPAGSVQTYVWNG
jgi:glucosylceramidase